MGRKRKKDDYPDEWDVVEESPEDSDARCPPFETVAETQDPDVDAVSEAISRLQTTFEEPDPVYRLKRSTKDTYSRVICKLTRVLRVPALLPDIERICVVMKQVQLEGWHLANLHVLRCLKEGEEVPELDQMFFYRCCSATLQNHSSRMINEMARLMNTNALNMIALHFRRRLHQYIRFRYAPEGKIELKYRDAKRLVDSCFCIKFVPEKDVDGNLTGNTTKAWTQWDDATDPLELELREWLGMVPWQWAIRAYSGHFLSKLYDMLKFMEAFAGKHPKQKGARVYSLLPVATSYQAAYVTINASTLFGLFSRVVDQPKVEEWLKSELKIVWTRKVSNPDQLPFSLRTFQSHKSEVMRSVFSVDQFETENRKFVDEWPSQRTPRRKTNDGAVSPTGEKNPKQTKAKTPEEIAAGGSFGKELFKLGPDYVPNVLIGIDPGMRSLVTAVSVGRLPRRRRQRRGRNRRRQCLRRPPRKQTVMEISTREYRHLARMNDFRFYNENLKKREPWYATDIFAKI
ncbi:hypothetical protein PHYPSEUDO_010123 [Phytophthora pseudosyringae]|uniref:Uncharacterized protein n=1 Tax=Phytophthora pseudosyringae TaxID=221518 RepID=A0A8T1VE73_9STRA|nr:hypothetical protein PHYPSEUDO_010123 [Phytophthora pseudosyringae]